jgi:hypothetical protein
MGVFMSITTKRMALLGTALTAITASTVFAAAPAFAGTDSGESVAYGCGGSVSSPTALGMFYSYGDLFDIWDECADGHSATIYVDVAPYNSTWDFTFQNREGKGILVSRGHDIPEGTDVMIQACSTEGSIRLQCGDWVTGTA